MSIIDAYGPHKQLAVMEDTWGHMYPKPKTKYPGTMLVAVGEYGDQVVISSDFPGLDCSPMRHELEYRIFDMFDFEAGRVAKVSCTLWFMKDIYRGKIIKASATYLDIT